MRHIIVEGMDGSGKDTLIRDLIKEFPDHTLHPRASSSLGGPVVNLAGWTADDVILMAKQEQGPYIYNRHPLISEPIYAPVRRINPGLKLPWDSPVWVSTWAMEASRHCVVVLCHPSYITIRSNLVRSGPKAHMPGVFENSWELYQKYSLLSWPRPMLRYDYTIHTPAELADRIRKAFDR